MESGISLRDHTRRRPTCFSFRARLLILALCLGSWAHSFSQDFQFRNFTELNGLPSSETYHAIQDRLGFVWICTDNGVARFDGDEFVIFNKSTGLIDNTVFGLYEDEQGRIWFRTYSGALAYYEGGSIRPYPHNQVLQPVIRTAIINKLVVQEDNLWFATNGQGPAGSVDSIGNITLLETGVATASPYFYAYAINKDEYLTGVAGMPRAKTTIVIGRHQFPVNIDPIFLNSPVIQSLQVGRTLYIAINKDLFRYRADMLEHVITFERSVINLSTDREANLWIGFFGGGVRRYSNHRFESYMSIRELAQNSVSATLQDSEGGYWFTTLDRGIFHFPNLSIGIDTYERVQKISAVAHTGDDLYTGNYAGKVLRIQPAQGASEVVHQSTVPIIAMFSDRRGNLWWSTANGYFIMTAQGEIETKPHLRAIRGFFMNSDGQVGAFNSTHVYMFDRNRNPGSRVDLQRRPVSVLTTDSVIYVGSLYGLERHDANFLPMDMTPFFEGRISAIQAIGPRLVLAGTIGSGLMMIDEGGRKMFNPKNGFNAENVYSILVDRDAVWLGTDRGVLTTTIVGLRSRKPNWKRLTRSSGLLSDKTNFLAKTDNKILAFSDQGFSIIPSDVKGFLNEKPVAYIKSILVNNELQDPMIGELEHTRNNISINIGVISFNNREILHRHRLHRTARWNYEKGDNISYFDLNPGNYNIEVGASADNVNWSAATPVVSILIRVPWWRSWLFIVIVSVFVILVSWVIYLLRVNAIKRKQEYLELINSHQQRLIDSEIRTLERERKRIATDLHDGVGTSLSSIKLMLADSLKAHDGERDVRVNEINENLTDVIAEIRRIVYDLRPPALERYGLQVGLKNLTERINNHGGISVMYDYYGQRDVAPQVSITVYRIVQELINNTLRHAKATEIRIHINQFDDEMNLMYEDNGIGMIGSRFNGLGLYSIESRVRSLSGRMSWESNHKGTFYNFDIPY